MADKLQITRKSALKGDDGYTSFTIRIKEETADNLEEIVRETHRTRNELVNIMLEYSIANCEIVDKKKPSK